MHSLAVFQSFPGTPRSTPRCKSQPCPNSLSEPLSMFDKNSQWCCNLAGSTVYDLVVLIFDKSLLLLDLRKSGSPLFSRLLECFFKLISCFLENRFSFFFALHKVSGDIAPELHIIGLQLLDDAILIILSVNIIGFNGVGILLAITSDNVFAGCCFGWFFV